MSLCEILLDRENALVGTQRRLAATRLRERPCEAHHRDRVRGIRVDRPFKQSDAGVDVTRTHGQNPGKV